MTEGLTAVVARGILTEDAVAHAGRDLPFGPAPAGLIVAEPAAVAERLAERILALVENARAGEERTPLGAALCWHEAGRLLAGRAGRPDEAWLCHSRALTVHPEHQPARRALRRLAIRAGDPAATIAILDAEIERATDNPRIAALLIERAAAEVRQEQTTAALATLREAGRVDSGSLVAPLLRLALTSRDVDDADLAEALGVLADSCTAAGGDSGLPLMLALIEERLGRQDAASARLQGAGAGEGAPIHGARSWAAARLALRAGQPEAAIRALGDLASLVRERGLGDHLAAALDRFRAAICALLVEPVPKGGEGGDPERRAGAEVEPRLIAALRAGDIDDEGRVLEEMAAEATTPAWRSALLAGAAATRLAAAADGAPLPAEVRGLEPHGRVLERLLAPEAAAAGEPPVPDQAPEAGIHAAVRDGDLPRVGAALDALRARGGDEDERWNLAVARAWLLDDRLDASADAVRVLRSAGDALDRAPLPSLIRGRVMDRALLADLALVEADHTDDPADTALKLAWAGHHLAGTDPERSVELHRRALELDPACPLSLAALSRGSVDHEALAEAHAAAAVGAADEERRAHLLRAGAHRLATGAVGSALSVFRQALEIGPEATDLWLVLLRLGLDAGAGLIPELFRAPEGAGSKPGVLTAVGSLALAADPEAAAVAFALARELDPADPIAHHGHFEALLACGRASLVSAELLEELGRVVEREERARLLLHLADLDSRHGKDRASAALSLLSLIEILPGYRPALGELAFHFARHGRRDELVPVLAGLARAVADDRDGAALAQMAWRGTAGDLDLLRLAVHRGAATPVQLAQLEALTDSPAERLDLLRMMSASLGDSPARLLRAAEAFERTGDLSGALAIVARLVEQAPGDMAALSELRRLQREAGDAEGEAGSLAALARASRVPEHRVEYLLAEARLARDGLGDPARGAACCVAALDVVPGSDEAYRMGRALLEELGDRPGLARLISRRIAGVDAAPVKHRLLQELAGVRLAIGEADGAKIALGLALELVPDDVPARRRLAALHTRDREWNEAIEQLMQAARLNRDPQVGQELFFDLGVLYADHSERLDLAEKSFVKVLGWNRGHFAAMERLAEVYASMGNWQRAAQALEQLTIMADSPAVKAAKMVALAEVVDTRLSRPKDAERLLNDARGLDPLGVGPIRGLADLYTRQRDGMALNVLLDQALASHSAALEADPDQPGLYANLYRILELKKEEAPASLAVAALDLLGARGDFPDIPPDVVEIQWQGGARAGDPSLAEFFCPKAIPPGLRETLRAVEEPIARSLGASARQVDLPRDSRLDRKHPLALMLNLLGPAFGIRGEVVCHRVAIPGLRFAPGAPGIALVPESLARCEDQPSVAFTAGSILALAREGLALATIVPEDRLRRIVAGVVKLAVPGFAPPGIDPAAIEEEVGLLRRAVPDKIVARVASFAFECGSALERPDLGRNLLAIAHRVGFVTTGSLSGALAALAIEHDRSAKPLALLPGAGSVVSFAFSKDHLELRRRMGI